MHAQIGDHLLVVHPREGTPRRDGEIVGLHHRDGTPPYDVRRSDTGRVTLVFPGPDVRVHSFHRTAPGTAADRPR